MCVSVWVCACFCLQRPEEDIGPPEARVLGRCEPPHVGDRNQPQVFWNSSKHSELLNYLSKVEKKKKSNDHRVPTSLNKHQVC